jgi:hypothetical protein
MATIVANDILRVVDYMKCTAQPQQGLNIHYYKATAVAGLPTTFQAAVALATQRKNKYANCMNVGAEYDGCSCQRFMGPLPLEEPQFSTLGFPQTGTVTGDLLPPDKSGIISWKTGKAGRKYRGRSYIPFPGEASNNVNGLPETAYVTSLTALLGALMTPTLIDDGMGNTVQLAKVIYHGRVVSSPYDLVTTGIAKDLWAVQHRRGDYGRPNVGGPFG